MKEAKPLTPLVNSMSAKGVLLGQCVFLVVFGVLFVYVSRVGAFVVFGIALGVFGLRWVLAYREIQKFELIDKIGA